MSNRMASNEEKFDYGAVDSLVLDIHPFNSNCYQARVEKRGRPSTNRTQDRTAHDGAKPWNSQPGVAKKDPSTGIHII